MRGPPAIAELRLRARELSPGGSLSESARVLLCLRAREMEAALPAALSTTRPGPLHDARVAGRRLRAGITLFQRLYPGRWHATVEVGRAVTQGLREARDLDIRRARLGRLARRLGGSSGVCRRLFSRLVEEAGADRRSQVARSDLAAAAHPAGGMGPFIASLWRPSRVRTADAERFSSVWLHSLALITLNTMPMASVESHGGVQHRLRIRGKALRYSLEMMQWRLGEEARWRIEVLRGAQDVLGELHDLDVFLEHVRGESAGCDADERGCLRDALELLEQERRRFFGRFLDLRAGLEKACEPVRFP